MKKYFLHLNFLAVLALLISCGGSTGELVGLPDNGINPGAASKVLKKLTTEEAGTSFDLNYNYTAGKLTSVSSSDNSLAYAVEYNGAKISKITRTVNEGGMVEVLVSNLTYSGNTLTEVNGTKTDSGVQTGSFKTTYTYTSGKPNQAKTQIFLPGSTNLLSTLTSNLQYSGNNLSSWEFKVEPVSSPPVVIPSVTVTTAFSNYDSNPNPFHTLPLAFTLTNCNFEIETEGPTGISVNNYKTISVTSNAGTQSGNITYTYDTAGYPTIYSAPGTVLKFEYQ